VVTTGTRNRSECPFSSASLRVPGLSRVARPFVSLLIAGTSVYVRIPRFVLCSESAGLIDHVMTLGGTARSLRALQSTPIRVDHSPIVQQPDRSCDTPIWEACAAYGRG